MFFVKFKKFYRISFLQKTAGWLLPISSNILDISLALLAINQHIKSQLTVCLGPPQRAVRKQFTVFVSKIFEITKVEGNVFFLAQVNATSKKGLFSRSSHAEVFCKKNALKYLVKLTGKHLCRNLSLVCRRETLLKRDFCIVVFL